MADMGGTTPPGFFSVQAAQLCKSCMLTSIQVGHSQVDTAAVGGANVGGTRVGVASLGFLLGALQQTQLVLLAGLLTQHSPHSHELVPVPDPRLVPIRRLVPVPDPRLVPIPILRLVPVTILRLVPVPDLRLVPVPILRLVPVAILRLVPDWRLVPIPRLVSVPNLRDPLLTSNPLLLIEGAGLTTPTDMAGLVVITVSVTITSHESLLEGLSSVRSIVGVVMGGATVVVGGAVLLLSFLMFSS